MNKKKLISIVLVLALTASTLTGCKIGDMFGGNSGGSGSSDDENTLGTTNYNDMEYEHFDDSEILGLLAECEMLCGDKKNVDTVIENFDAASEQLEILAQNYVICELHNYADVTDQYYIDEFSYIGEVYTNVFDEFCTVGRIILESPCGDRAREEWEEADIEYFEEYIEMTDEQKRLDKEENDLEIAYNEAAAGPFTTNIGGQEYGVADLPDLYYAGVISADDYYYYYEQILASENAVLGPIYVDLVKVRQQIAVSYGYDSYTEYAYVEIYDRDYTPEQAAELAEKVKQYFVTPADDLYYAMDDNDYDTITSIASNMTEDEWISMVQDYLGEVDPSLEEGYAYMLQYNLYDLEARENKYDGGFTTLIGGYNEPYCFICPGSGFYDVMTLVHEYGHYNAYYQNIAEGDSVSNLDLAEIHSQGLELLYLPYYGQMLGDDSLNETADIYVLYQKAASVSEGCMYDEFQQAVYALDDPTLEQINSIFGDIASQYGYQYGTMNQYLWQQVPHNFQSPLYYISYAVSALPALEIWEISTTDYNRAVDVYLSVVDAGEGGSYLETLETCGLSSPFEDGYIETLSEKIEDIAY